MVRFGKIILLILFLVTLTSCKKSISKLQEAKEICLANKGIDIQNTTQVQAITPPKTSLKTNTYSSSYTVSEEDKKETKENSGDCTPAKEKAVSSSQSEENSQNEGLPATSNSVSQIQSYSFLLTEPNIENTIPETSSISDNQTSPDSSDSATESSSYQEVISFDNNDINTEICSSCLSPARLDLPESENNQQTLSLADIFSIKTPNPSKRKPKVGSALPASLLELEWDTNIIHICWQIDAGKWYKRKLGLGIPGDSITKNMAREKIIIAVIDSGVDYDHSDLADNMWKNSNEIADNGNDDDGNGYIDDVRGWDFVNDDKDPYDEDGHGTHVAGIISEVLFHSELMPDIKIMPVKVMTHEIENIEEAITRGITYAADNGANVLNLSFGVNDYSQSVKESIDYAYGKGCVIVAAAGNSGSDIPCFPAYLPRVIAVGANNIFGNPSPFTNRFVDLYAPGEGIPLWDYLVNGTSFAAPFVSAIAALLLWQDPNLLPEEIRYNLRLQAYFERGIFLESDPLIKKPIYMEVPPPGYGYGNLNAFLIYHPEFIENKGVENNPHSCICSETEDKISILEAKWNPEVPGKAEREELLNAFYDFNGTDIPERMQPEVKIVLRNPTDNNASLNVTYIADGSNFDAGYELFDHWYWPYNTEYALYESNGNEYTRFLKLWGDGEVYPNIYSYEMDYYGEDLLSITETWPIGMNPNGSVSYIDGDDKIYPSFWPEETPILSEEDEAFLSFERYLFPFRSYSIITKLNDDGIENSYLTIHGPIEVPARSTVLVPTWSFLFPDPEQPFDFFCANACEISGIYPIGSVICSVVIEENGVITKVIPMEDHSL